ncbi:C6 zinc finger domain protein [Aspergillus eucalypticola CBS 122712]|uniref:C6 zinc finger domain protein n=1 Tax=Aspergillus eucalypticola (strain CBS 122712 / IBT 29274) TaxID=1448314 RepID=A0A317WGH8_ASPEC|nr:C6 zinc finger domain protein [Aspergillus eucalypticola CBS 122712]PWY85574.1 C6 zinc finger domain protein [Aspergillus eucalypticola CBS 122712]
MPSRRSHTKSHHGCAQCKHRRIKCDEFRPICSSCHKKHIRCSFEGEFTPQTLHHDFAAPRTRVDLIPRNDSFQLPLLDLELLNHWHVATVRTLVHDKSTEKVLREFVPQEALSHPFLMHSLLALSALHLSHHGPVDRRHKYTEAAMTHNNHSLSLCKPLLNNVTSGNCHALFAFACFVVMFSFAAHGPKVDPGAQHLSAVLEVFMLIRGVASIVGQARPWIEAGGMRDLLKLGEQPREESNTAHARELYARISDIYDNLRRPSRPECYDSESLVIEESVQKFLDLLQQAIGVANPAPSIMMRWPAVINAKYLDLLQANHPTALVVLAHYGVALELMAENWWLDGWGAFLVNTALYRSGPAPGPELVWAWEAIKRKS